MQATDYLSITETESLINDVEELLRIIGKIQVTTKCRNS
jgi:hypothetical protein